MQHIDGLRRDFVAQSQCQGQVAANSPIVLHIEGAVVLEEGFTWRSIGEQKRGRGVADEIALLARFAACQAGEGKRARRIGKEEVRLFLPRVFSAELYRVCRNLLG